MPIFKNFKEMGQTIKAGEKENSEKEKLLRAEKFNELVKDRFEELPPGFQFKPDFPNIDSISVIKSGEENILNIIIFYRNAQEKSRQYSVSMAENGKLSSNLPTELQISSEQLYDEVLNGLKLKLP